MTQRNRIVISLGGSLLYTPEGISTDFLKAFNLFIRAYLEKNPNTQFFLVVGGGIIASQYRNDGKEILEHKPTNEDLDWIGIHATRLNAHLIKTIFKDIAHPHIIKHYEIIRRVDEAVIVGAGWKPGVSTDFCAAMICEDYGVNKIINLTSVSNVYDKDPKKYKDARPLNNISWKNYQKLIGDKWVPETHAPFDPIASKKAEEMGLKVINMRGDNFKNLEKYFNGEEFTGTVISN